MSFKILLLGDQCTDEYYIGSCDRLSPEAPVPVMKIREYYTVPGMAANVLENLLNLDCDVTFISNQTIITKTRYIDDRSGQHLLRVDDEDNIDAWKGSVSKPWEYYDAVVISDYNKGFLSYQQIEHVIHNFPGPVFIDTKKTDLARFSGAFVKINNQEFNQATSHCDDLIVTLGASGARYQNETYSAPLVEVSDVCGAGDTFLSALTYKYLENGHDITGAIKFATRVASITVQHRGNYSPTLEEIV
jgi:D-beta-D-heptose 7-phosphate kinase/D-beta-D-heptose 1-phosphate adenosyltransferase